MKTKRIDIFLYVLLAVVIVTAFITNYKAVFDPKLDLNGDNMTYFMLSQSLEQGLGFTDQYGLQLKPHMHFPPGYPLFMACLRKLGFESVTAMKIANGVLLCLSILLLTFAGTWWLKKIVKVKNDNNKREWTAYLPFAVSFAVGLMCCFHAELLRWATIMMSEMLYMAVTFSMLTLVVSLDDTIKNNADMLQDKKTLSIFICKSVCLLALLVYVYFVRTMGTSIILAVIIWACYRTIEMIVCKLRRKNSSWQGTIVYALLLAVYLCGFLVTHYAWQARNIKANPNYKSDYKGDFKMKPGGGEMTTFADWTDRIQNNLQDYTVNYVPKALLGNLEQQREATAGRWMLGCVLMILCLIGILSLPRGGLIMLLYVGATYCVLMVWPEQYAGIRYFVALVPLLIFSLLAGVVWLLMWIAKRSDKVAFICCLTALLFFTIVTVQRYKKDQVQYRQMAKIRYWERTNNPPMTQYLAASKWIGKQDIGSLTMCRKPEVFYMYSSYHHCCGFPKYATEEEIIALIDERKPDFIIIDWWFQHAYRTLYPAIVKYPARFRLVQQFGKYMPNNGMYPTMIFAVNYENEDVK